MNLVKQNELMEITEKLYSLNDIDLANAIQNIDHLYEVHKMLKNAEKDEKIVLAGDNTAQ